MGKRSPWGEILELDPILSGIDYISTALHSGLMISDPHFKSLSEFTQNLGVKLDDRYFFDKDDSIHLVNLELKLNLFSEKESFAQIIKNYPQVVSNFKNYNNFEEIISEIRSSDIENQNSLYANDPNFIHAAIPLDEGWKITTLDGREYLVNDYVNQTKLTDLELIGDVTNFFNFNTKMLDSNCLPSFIKERVPLEEPFQILAVASRNKSAYILELYQTNISNYVGEINLFNCPLVIKAWCDE